MDDGKGLAINQFSSTRRRFVANAGTTLALGALPHTLLAGTKASFLKSSHFIYDNTMVVHSVNDQASFAFAKALSSHGANILELAQDPFQTWRNGLSQMMESNLEFRLIGLTTWSDYLVLKGMAAELRRYSLREKQHWIKGINAQKWGEEQANRLAATSLNQEQFENDRLFIESTKVNQKQGYESYISWIIS